MARTNLTIKNLTPNSGNTITSTTIDSTLVTNGVTVRPSTSGIPAGGNLDNLFLIVTNSAASPKAVTVKAGVNPPAFRSGIGDTSVSVAASGTSYLGPFETSRFVQADGAMYIDLESGMTGSIAALLLPSRF